MFTHSPAKAISVQFESARRSVDKMPSTLFNKHELKSRDTRDLLLRAAETIFVRDGYEGAELGEIAALAGRTKGSIYAHFKNKEDLFIALFAERMRFHSNRMHELLRESTSAEQSLKIFREFYVSTLRDESWSLLLLEFKLLRFATQNRRDGFKRPTRSCFPWLAKKERMRRSLDPADRRRIL